MQADLSQQRRQGGAGRGLDRRFTGLSLAEQTERLGVAAARLRDPPGYPRSHRRRSVGVVLGNPPPVGGKPAWPRNRILHAAHRRSHAPAHKQLGRSEP